MAGGVRTTTALALLRSRRLHPIIVRKGCHRLIAFAGHRLAAMKVMPVGVGVRLAAVVSATTVVVGRHRFGGVCHNLSRRPCLLRRRHLAAMKVMPVGVGVRLATVVSATTVASPLGGATIGSRCPVSLDARRQVRGG